MNKNCKKNRITKCNKCDISCNQKPLVENMKKSDIMFLGISAKMKETEDEMPLSENTNSGKLIKMIEERLLEENNNLLCYRSNMVKCVPLNEEGKIRYPDNLEIENCIENLEYELNIVKPKVVVFLGRLVEKYLKKKIIELGYNVITIYHPSYIYVYRKKEIEKYVEESSKNILKYV
mgnify:FL=1